MPTTRFCALIGVPERTWRARQARARAGQGGKGPWPRPARASVREVARRHALAHPAWGHRKVWAMCRHDGHVVSQATVLRLLRDEGLILEASYQRERRQLAARRKAAFAVEPTGANQVWQLDFSEFETTTAGTWRIAGCRDYWSKYELGWHVSPTANMHDAIAAVEAALTEAQRLAGRPLADLAPRDEDGHLQPMITLVTDNGGPFRWFRFEAFVATHPEIRHVRTRVRTPGQNGSRERGFGTLKYERLFLEEVDDVLDLVQHSEDYRIEYNTVRPHEAIAWNRPHEVHTGTADPLVPNFSEPQNLPSTDAGHEDWPQGQVAEQGSAGAGAGPCGPAGSPPAARHDGVDGVTRSGWWRGRRLLGQGGLMKREGLGGLRQSVDDTSAADWVVAAVRDFDHTVGSMVPPVFEAYARLLHPATRYDDRDRGEEVRWAQVAAANGRRAHAGMQWVAITGSWRYLHADAQPPVWDTAPEEGSLPAAQADLLVSVLERFTDKAEECSYAVWDGYAMLALAAVAETVHMPAREMRLLSGPLSAAARVSMESEPFEQGPSLWSPADRTWCVATDVDLMSTYLGGSRACIDAALVAPGLETWEVGEAQRVSYDSDTLNPVPPPPE